MRATPALKSGAPIRWIPKEGVCLGFQNLIDWAHFPAFQIFEPQAQAELTKHCGEACCTRQLAARDRCAVYYSFKFGVVPNIREQAGLSTRPPTNIRCSQIIAASSNPSVSEPSKASAA